MQKNKTNIIVTSKNGVWSGHNKIASFNNKGDAINFGKTYSALLKEDLHIQSSRTTSKTRKGQFIK